MALKTLFDILCAQLKSFSETLHHWLKTSLQREQAVDKVRPDSFVPWDIDLELPAPTLQQARNPYREAAIYYQDLPPYLEPLEVRPTSNIDEGDKGKPLYSCNTTPPLPPPNVNSNQCTRGSHGDIKRLQSQGILSFTMNTTPRDTAGQDTTAQSTMDNGLIEAKLISREYCLSHWVITFSQSGKCINADLSKNAIRYSRDPLPEVISSIGFRIKNGKPPIDELLEDLFLPPSFMDRPKDFCDCVQWVFGVIYNYSALDCIETVSTTGISRTDLVGELVRRQSDALVGINMGLTLSELACVEDYGSLVRSNDRSDSHAGANPRDAEVDDGK